MTTRREFLIGTLGLVSALANGSCGGEISAYDASPMANETHKVKGFTEKLTTNDRTIEEKVKRVVEWGQKNLFHYDEQFDFETYGQTYETYDPSKISIEDIFRERAVGCHDTVFTLATMLRSIDIDADYVRSESFGPNVESPGHGILYVPEIERYVHGDAICLLNTSNTDAMILDRETETKALIGDKPTRERLYNKTHCGGHLKREGRALYIQNGVVHAGFEGTEFPRLQKMLVEYRPQLTEPAPNGFGTKFVTKKVPIEQLPKSN